MAIGSVITAGLAKVGWSILGRVISQGGAAGVKRLFSRKPERKAIRATANRLPFIPNVAESLKRWTKSDEFAKLMEDLGAGHIQTPTAALVESFIVVGEFYHGIGDPTDDATRVLETFLRYLVEELLKSPTGAVLGYGRGEGQHRELLDLLTAFQKGTEQQSPESNQLSAKVLSTFLTPAKFFRPYLRRKRVFHHAWRMVGREDVVAALDEFVRSDGRQVAVMMGRTGVGKTKINFAFARGFMRRHKAYELRFAAEGVPLNEASFGELPDVPCVIVVDDAHKRDDIKLLLEGARQRTQPTKVILVTRPWALSKVDVQLGETSYDPSEIIRLPEVQPLTLEELTRLAAQALGRKYAGYADQLVRETKDSPLFTVLGGRVIAKENIPPKLFLSSDDFLKVLLARFSDLLLGEISNRFGVDISRKLLSLLAALNPIGNKNEELLREMSEFLGMSEAELMIALDEFEEGGILIRRGYTLKITPDFIAEYLLENACLTAKGEPTGYADQVYEKFNQFSSTRLYRNLAELDWRVRNSKNPNTSLFDGVWRATREKFIAADHFRRKTMLDGLQFVAFLQAKRVLLLAEYAMRNPATEPEEETWYTRFDHTNVLRAVPAVLEAIAQDDTYLPRCCELLWELVSYEAGRVSTEAVKALQDLARYNPYRSVKEQHVLLDAAEGWMPEPTADRAGAVLDVVDQMLRKNDHVDQSRGAKIISSVITVQRASTEELRERALHIVERCALSEDVRVVLRALLSLKRALLDPSPLFGQEIPVEDCLQWLPEQDRILGMIEELATRNGNPFVRLGIADAIGWEAVYASVPEIKNRARSIFNIIPDSYEVRLIQALHWDFDHLHLRVDVDSGDEGEDHFAKGNAVAEMCRGLADELVTRNPLATDGLSELNRWMQLIQESGWNPRLWTLHNMFLEQIAGRYPAYAAALCDALVAQPDCPLAARSGDMLSVLRAKEPQPALGICQRFMETNHQSLCYAVAQCYASGTWLSNVQTEDHRIFKTLINDPRPAIKKVAIGFLPSLFREEPVLALELAVAVDTGGDEEIIDGLIRNFSNDAFGIDPDRLDDDQLRTLLAKLEPLDELGRDYHLDKFLTYVSERSPLDVLNLFISRLKRKKIGEFHYHPVPDAGLGTKLKGISARTDYPEIVRKIRDFYLTPDDEKLYELPPLFEAVSLNYNEEGLTALNEWIDSGDPTKIEAALLLLDEVHPPFSFEHVDFVINALRKAEAAGEECRRTAWGVFSSGAVPRERHRMIGELPAAVVRQLEQASAVLNSLQAGTPEHRFYEYIVQDAERTLEDERASDEQLTEY